MSYEYWNEIRGGGTATLPKSEPQAGPARSPKPARESKLAGLAQRSSLAQLFAGGLGVVFLAVGVLGFIPGIVSMFGELTFVGPDSDAQLLGLFDVSVAHNLVHILFGVGLLAARSVAWSLRYLVLGGAAYLAVFVYGLLVVGSDSAINFLPVNAADNVLHLALGVAMIALGLVARRAIRTSPAAA